MKRYQVVNNYKSEFDLSAGECIITNRELNGWIWGFKESNPEDYGWAPLNHLKEI